MKPNEERQRKYPLLNITRSRYYRNGEWYMVDRIIKDGDEYIHYVMTKSCLDNDNMVANTVFVHIPIITHYIAYLIKIWNQPYVQRIEDAADRANTSRNL